MATAGTFRPEIPEDVLDEARIPAGEMDATLKGELAVHLVARGLLPKTAARKLAGLGRIAFDDLLGQRGIPSDLTEEDFEAEMLHLDAYRAARGQAGG